MFSGNEWLILVIIALLGVVPVAAVATIAVVAARRSGPSQAGPHTAQSAPPQSTSGWFGDPSGRHELRYWDGTRWTDSVASGGEVSADPY